MGSERGPSSGSTASPPPQNAENRQTELFNEDFSNSLINFSRNAQIMSVQRWSLLEHGLACQTFKRPVFGAAN